MGDKIDSTTTTTIIVDTQAQEDSKMEPRAGELQASTTDDAPSSSRSKAQERITKDFGFLPIPKHLRYDQDNPPHFGLLLNMAFGFASTFIVANLYYCQPLLIQLSLSFNATNAQVSRIPTLIQAGYAVGLVLISPLGDLIRRRPLILSTVIISTGLTVGLAITNSLVAFEVLSFIVGVASITPQILVPLAADLAPADKRASAISIVLSGLLFGILIARVLAGVIAQFVSWRVVYYVAVGVQAVVLGGAYWVLPDYPSKNGGDLTYWKILWTMGKFAVTEPVLIQACAIHVCASAVYSNYWVTLTFLLGGEPYNYSTLIIGLFGLLGIAGVATGPIGGKVVDRLVPWYGSLLCIIMLAVFQAVETGAGGVNVSAVIIAAFGLDVFRQMLQVSLTTAIFSISVAARSRLNAVAIFSIFIGQVMGTSAGTHIFVNFGWRASAAFSLGLCGFELLILLLRGPHCKRFTWFGYEGGVEFRKDIVEKRARQKSDTEKGSKSPAESQGNKNGVEADTGTHEGDDEKLR
ncbi:MFS superfamily [Pholiota conissans]|uniref:MFS superfamily n=1 Tax=Pholiota conissans TaxID=109636 RepID=A0A9P6CYP3_9AGAR|nr:MFS superfamily [Pholiota conissans]